MVQQFNKAKISITLDQDVHEFVVKLADEEIRSVSQQINKIIKDYIKSQEKKG